jgi:hypothetical protein
MNNRSGKVQIPDLSATANAVKVNTVSLLLWAVLVMASILAVTAKARAASDLTLAPDLSFTDDSSPNFPIVAKDPGDATIARSRPTVIFFGTSNCWNTTREAQRLVAIYPEYRDRIQFVVVDLRRPSPAQQQLVDLYYRGYIPTLAIFDKSGRLVYDRAGETAEKRGDTSHLQQLINSALHQE